MGAMSDYSRPPSTQDNLQARGEKKTTR